MKSSQSKATQSSSASETSSPSSTRNRDAQNDFSPNATTEDTNTSSTATLRGRNEFANPQDQGQNNPTAESYASYEGAAQSQQPYDQQNQYGQNPYAQQENPNFRRQSQQQQNVRSNEALGQSGMNALVEAWTGLVLGQVQIATQAAIRLAQCCFSPSLISNISEVQRRYAEDSISSATAAASRFAQFTPRALNQNLQQFNQNIHSQDAQQNPYGQNQYGQQLRAR